MKKLLNRVSTKNLIILTIFLGLVPFVPEPHAWQKLKMLFAGDLMRGADIIDLAFHLLPAVILAAKLYVNRTANDDA